MSFLNILVNWYGSDGISNFSLSQRPIKEGYVSVNMHLHGGGGGTSKWPIHLTNYVVLEEKNTYRYFTVNFITFCLFNSLVLLATNGPFPNIVHCSVNTSFSRYTTETRENTIFCTYLVSKHVILVNRNFKKKRMIPALVYLM